MTVNSAWIEGSQKASGGQSFLEWYGEYAGGAGGATNTLEFLKGTASLGREVSGSLVLQGVEKGAGAALSGMGVVGIPASTRNAVHSFQALSEDDGVDIVRKVLSAIKNGMKAIVAWVAIPFLFTASPPLRVITNSAALTAEFSELPVSMKDYFEASKLSSVAKGPMKEEIEYSRDYYFYRSLKNILAIASGILGIATIALGFALIPLVLTIIIGLSATLASIKGDFHRDSKKHPIIEFSGVTRK